MPDNIIGTFEIEEVGESHRWQATLAALTGLLANPELNGNWTDILEPQYPEEHVAAVAITIGRLVAEEFCDIKE